VLSAEEVSPAFHPRFDARTKTYRYRLWNDDVMSPFESAYAWHVPGPLDVEAMRAAAQLLEGRHDFAAFQATGSDVGTTVRQIMTSRLSTPQLSTTVDSEDTGKGLFPTGLNIRVPRVHCGGELIVYEITGTGFLRHMVRIVVGSLIEIGRGRQTVDWFDRAIASRDRASAGPTAPPHGLFLVRVEYPSVLAAGS
jgi:tRNA pseudouridine38-40 synthase